MLANKRSSKDKLKDTWKRSFRRRNKYEAAELQFPTSLSPISTFESPSLHIHHTQSPSSEASDSPTYSSTSSFTSNDTADLFDSFHPKNKGPKIRPYIYTQVQQQQPNARFNKHISGLTCFICEEFVENKLAEESILELGCGDFIHEQCLNVSVDFKIKSLLENGTFTASKVMLAPLALPKCQGKNCELTTETIQLVDGEFHDALMTKAIAKSVEYDKIQLRISRRLSTVFDMNERDERGRDPVREQTVYEEQESVSSVEHTIPGNATNTTPTTATPTTATPVVTPMLRTPIDLPFRLTRGESLLSYNSIPSRSVSPSPSTTTSNLYGTIQVSSHKFLLPDKLKDHLLQMLLKKCTDISLTNLVKLGNLRLADDLLVKESEYGAFKSSLVYLFDNYLVVVDSSSKYWMFHWKDSVFVFESGAVKIASDQKVVWLSSQKSSIIEKWVVALSDISFDFPPEVITSTLDVGGGLNVRARLSDSTINLLDPENGRFSPLKSCGTLDGDYSFLSGDQLIKEIMQQLETSTYAFGVPHHSTSSVALDKVEKVGDIDDYPEPDLDSEPDSVYSDSDSDIDSDEEVIQQFL